MPSSDAPANIRVLVRIRPLNEKEKAINPTPVLNIDDCSFENDNVTGTGTIRILEQPSRDSIATTPGREVRSQSFTYDAVFGPNSKQTEIFDGVNGIIDAVCEGYNGTIMAYGQTGSGKTHTIFGEEGL